MALKQYAFTGVIIATVMIGLTGFISEGLAIYNVTGNVDTGELSKLESIENSTSIAADAQKRASSINTRQDFSTLPGVLQILKLPFEAVPIIGKFIGTSMNILGLSSAYGATPWPYTLAISFVTITISFMILRRLR